jgi:arylsulfatase A-like enzyme
MRAYPSLVLVTVDCLRYDHVGFMGYGRATTPFLDSLAAQSCVFADAIVGGAPTYYSLPSILASRYPLAFGRDVVGLAPGESTLATVLKQAGYATAAFNAGNPYLSERFGYDQGFEVFHEFLDAPAGPIRETSECRWHSRGRWNERLANAARSLGLGRVYEELYFQYCERLNTPRVESLDQLRRFPAADVLVDQAIAWLDSVHNVPFFLWLHVMDPHAPYYPVQEALRLMGDAKTTPREAAYFNNYWNRRDLSPSRLKRHRESIIRLYDAGIRWVDVQLSRLVNALQSRGAWKDCVLVLTADHGEEFLEHGSRFHPQRMANEELIKVPLLIRFTDGQPSQTCKAVLSHIDLAPTLLDAMNLPIPCEFQGRSRWNDLRSANEWEDPAIIDCTESTNPNRAEARLQPRVLCVRDRRYKLILKFRSGDEQLYDLHVDPVENNPIAAGSEMAIRRGLLKYAYKHMTRPATAVDLECQVRARLRELQIELCRSDQNS